MPELSLFETDAISRVAVYDQIKSLTISRKLRRPSTFRLEVATQTPRYEMLTRGRYIGLSDMATQVINRVMRIDQLERSTEADSVIITGRDYAGWFDTRICVPPGGASHHVFSDLPAETIIKELVASNAGPGAPDVNRRLPNLVIELNQARGQLMTVQARYQALSDMLEEVLNFDGGGYQIVYVPGPTNQHRFEYISPTNRSATVFLDLEFESVTSQQWIESDIDMRDSLYVAGQGEGSARTVILRYKGGAARAGLNRREALVDARDLNTTPALEDRGDAILAQMAVDNRHAATIYERGSFRYGRDFFLGDIVTVQNRKWALDVQSRVVAATLAWTDTEQPAVTVELDRPWPTIKERVSQEAYGLSTVAPKGAVDYHSENHASRHALGAADSIFPYLTSTTTNPNDANLPSGFYEYGAIAGHNMPLPEVGYVWAILHVKLKGTVNYGYQIAQSPGHSARLWFRYLQAGVYGPWTEMPLAGSPSTFRFANLIWGSEGSRSEPLPAFNSTNIPSGFYSIGDAANSPKPGYLWNVLHMVWYQTAGYTNNYITQIATAIHDVNQQYTRHCINGAWGTWRKILTTVNSGGWLTLVAGSLGTAVAHNATIWDIYAPANYASYNAMKFQCVFYPTANYTGYLYMTPIKNQFTYAPNMTTVVEKIVAGVAPVYTALSEASGARLAESGQMLGMDYGQHLEIEFQNTNGHGMMYWKSQLFIRDHAMNPIVWRAQGTQRGSHVGGSLSGIRLQLDAPALFYFGSIYRVMGRRDEQHGGA